MSGRVGDLSKEQEECLQKVPSTILRMTILCSLILIEQNKTILVTEKNV